MKQISLLLCAALLLLAACSAPAAQTGASPSPPSAPPAATQEPVASEPAASEPAQPAAGVPESDTLQDPEGLTAALDECVAFGQGEAGGSLKAAIAAARLLNWAEANAQDSSVDAIQAHLTGWMDGLDEELRARFWENWPSVQFMADAMIQDLESQLPLLGDAGDPQLYDAYTPACFERFECALEGLSEAE